MKTGGGGERRGEGERERHTHTFPFCRRSFDSDHTISMQESTRGVRRGKKSASKLPFCSEIKGGEGCRRGAKNLGRVGEGDRETGT
jgi:hypothetical protein